MTQGMSAGYLSVCSGNVLWLSSQVMVAGGLEVTAQENRATKPSVITMGTGCNTNSEIPGKKKRSIKPGSISSRTFQLKPALLTCYENNGYLF